MLTGLKLSCLACECVFYRQCIMRGWDDPRNQNFEDLEMQSEPMDRAHRVDEKNGVISLVIMFTPDVMALW